MAGSKGFMFGPWLCNWGEAFYLTPLSIAIVNTKPIVPGHVLVLSRRVVPLFADLTTDEVVDLWNTVQKISGPIKRHFERQALTMAIQDGPAAGQTVPHVHVHVLPRVEGDFPKNDQVYDELDKTNLTRDVKIDAENRKPRTMKEMHEEALELRLLYNDSLPVPEQQACGNIAHREDSDESL